MITPIRPDFDKPNYDESNIAPYTLEDPLVFADGTPLTSPDQWPARRKEILGIFASEMYGQEPPAPICVLTERFEFFAEALGGFAVREQYKMWFREDKTGPCIHWLLYRPRYAKGPVPTILFLNFNGNAELTPETEIPLNLNWCRNAKGDSKRHTTNPGIRGRMADPRRCTVMPIGMILARGYAVMTACYCEVSPDPESTEKDPDFNQDNFAYTGVFNLWPKRDERRTDNTTALGAWAWALSRGRDLIERIPELDASRAVVTGCSRLGKAAFLAAARDERFPVCVINQSGGGGVPLAKRDFGENIATEMRMFKHWYCKAYGKYAKNPAKLLTFDQHLLLATLAPRHVLVQGFMNQWFDTKGEFLSCQAASPVWTFLGKPGLPAVDYPDVYDTSAIGPYVGYVRRTEEHGIAAYDWQWLLDFADNAWRK